MSRRTTGTLLVLLALLLPGARATAAEPMCELGGPDVARPLDGQRLLRRLSLDLRGRVPTFAEQSAQAGRSDVAEDVIDAYLRSPEFVEVMRRYHEELLWPNLEPVDVAPLQHKLYPYPAAPGVILYFSPLRALFLRSVAQAFPPCRNEPVQYDAAGKIRMFPMVAGGQTVGQQEGYVEVEPYWAPGTKVKVCALDAQAAETAALCPAEWQQSPYLKQFCDQFGAFGALVGFTLAGSPTACDTALSFLAPACGCGPNLRQCSTAETEALVKRSLIDQQMRMIDEVVAADRPYTEILTTRTSAVNGYLAHYLTYQSRLSFDVFGELDRTSPVPSSLGWKDGNRWTAIARTGRHAGVLTTPGYLLKYQSNRGRAHRFYNAFECSAFLPAGALPSPSEPCSKRQDLTQRCGCQACHVALEPMAGHWGRFAEYGLTPLDEQRYPRGSESVCTNFKSLEQFIRCFRFYQVDAVGDELPFRGLLKPYVFRTAPEVARLEAGPAALAMDSAASGRLGACTVRKIWGHFMRRAPTPDEEQTAVPDLKRRFEGGGWSLRALVKEIVSHPAYRRLP